jgi:lipid A disaccharide synthetase
VSPRFMMITCLQSLAETSLENIVTGRNIVKEKLVSEKIPNDLKRASTSVPTMSGNTSMAHGMDVWKLSSLLFRQSLHRVNNCEP